MDFDTNSTYRNKWLNDDNAPSDGFNRKEETYKLLVGKVQHRERETNKLKIINFL